MRFVLPIVLALAACGGTDARAPSDTDRATGTVTGVIVDLDQASPTEVRGFELKDGDDRYDIAIDPDHDYGFPLPHLRDHLVSSDPVRVEFEERDGRLVARSIEDV